MPNAGGSWTLFAKTDSPLGIAAISIYAANISSLGLTVEPDIGSIVQSPGTPYHAVIGGAVNVLYGQDLSALIVAGVGTPLTSDGPDALGNPTWNGATKIFTGAYSGAVPFFTTVGSNSTSALVLLTTIAGPTAKAASANVTTVVRVAVPEPATIQAALVSAVAALAAMRKRVSVPAAEV